MGETDTDAADQFDARVSAGRMDESTRGLWRRVWRLPRNVVAISSVSLLNDASSEIVYPLLPAFLKGLLGVSSPYAAAVIGLIEGAAESVSSLLKLFSGYFSDRRGRRKGFVVFGYALAGLMRPLLGFASSWHQVLFIRLADRVGKGIRSAPRDAMIADATPPHERGLAFGFHRAMDHCGAVVGPLLGAAIIYVIAENRAVPTTADYRTVFLLASVPALAAVLVAAVFVREKRRGAAPVAPAAAEAGAEAVATPPPQKLSLRGFDGNFKRFLVLVSLFTLSNSSDAFLILRAQDAGVGGASIPLLWSALHVSKVISSLVGGNLSDRLGRKTLIVSGWLLYALVYLAFARVSTPGEAWALFLVYGVYFGLAEGAEKALVADLVRPEQRGTAYGLYNLAFGITVLPASLLMGAVWGTFSPEAAFVTSAAIGTTAALLLAFFVRQKKMSDVRH
ncbi:MAG: MFS transporter [Acidobacteria bacterium]|nr:MFS transporter [Acidobacteriota bacterium]